MNKNSTTAKTHQLLKEIINSEKKYFYNLKLLRNEIIKSMNELIKKISIKQFESFPYLHIFQNIVNIIFDLNSNFYEKLKSVNTDSVILKASPLIKAFIEYLKTSSIYIQYASFANVFIDVVEESKVKSNSFVSGLTEIMENRKLNGITMKEFISFGFKRNLEYEKYVEKLCLLCNNQHAHDIKEHFKKLNKKIIQAKERYEDTAELIELEKQFKGDFQIISPGRKLIKSGKLKLYSDIKKSKTYNIFLCSDKLIVGVKTLKTYSIKTSMNLFDSNIKEFEDVNNSFIVGTSYITFVISAEDTQEMKEWLKEIKNTLKIINKKYSKNEIGEEFMTFETVCKVCSNEFNKFTIRNRCSGCKISICENCSYDAFIAQFNKRKFFCLECFNASVKSLLKKKKKKENESGLSFFDMLNDRNIQEEKEEEEFKKKYSINTSIKSKKKYDDMIADCVDDILKQEEVFRHKISKFSKYIIESFILYFDILGIKDNKKFIKNNFNKFISFGSILTTSYNLIDSSERIYNTLEEAIKKYVNKTTSHVLERYIPDIGSIFIVNEKDYFFYFEIISKKLIDIEKIIYDEELINFLHFLNVKKMLEGYSASQYFQIFRNRIINLIESLINYVNILTKKMEVHKKNNIFIRKIYNSIENAMHFYKKINKNFEELDRFYLEKRKSVYKRIVGDMHFNALMEMIEESKTHIHCGLLKIKLLNKSKKSNFVEDRYWVDLFYNVISYGKIQENNEIKIVDVLELKDSNIIINDDETSRDFSLKFPYLEVNMESNTPQNKDIWVEYIKQQINLILKYPNFLKTTSYLEKSIENTNENINKNNDYIEYVDYLMKEFKESLENLYPERIAIILKYKDHFYDFDEYIKKGEDINKKMMEIDKNLIKAMENKDMLSLHQNLEKAKEINLQNNNVLEASKIYKKIFGINFVLKTSRERMDMITMDKNVKEFEHMGYKSFEYLKCKKLLEQVSYIKELGREYVLNPQKANLKILLSMAKIVNYDDDLIQTCKSLLRKTIGIEKREVVLLKCFDEEQIKSIIKISKDINYKSNNYNELEEFINKSSDEKLEIQIINCKEKRRLLKLKFLQKKKYYDKNHENLLIFNYPGLKNSKDIMQYSKIKISSSLTSSISDHINEDKLSKDANVIFFEINEFMNGGDKLRIINIIRYCILEKDIRDECYCLLIKQMSWNPEPKCYMNGWDLMKIFISSFPPSEKFEKYLENYLMYKSNSPEVFINTLSELRDKKEDLHAPSNLEEMNSMIHRFDKKE